MNDKAKETRNAYMKAYMREYRQKNKSRIKAINERYWTNKSNRDKNVTK